MTRAGPWEVLRELRPELDLALLERYAAEVERWNRAVRLVGPREIAGIRVQIADALQPFLLLPPVFPLLDIGSGAGLPGLPVAIAWPGARVVCLEALGKRVSFLRHAVRHLGLKTVGVVAARAEERAADPALAGAFYTVTARAVTDPASLLELATPFLAAGGRVVLPRGNERLEAVEGWVLAEDRAYAGLPEVGPRRVAVYHRAGS